MRKSLKSRVIRSHFRDFYQIKCSILFYLMLNHSITLSVDIYLTIHSALLSSMRLDISTRLRMANTLISLSSQQSFSGQDFSDSSI